MITKNSFHSFIVKMIKVLLAGYYRGNILLVDLVGGRGRW
jgi:hypothetical protein